MTLLLAAAVGLLTMHLMHIREAIVVREARWKLYEIRDRLRALAIEDQRVRAGAAFSKLDETLTALAPNIQRVGFWSLVAAYLLGGREWSGTGLVGLQHLVGESGDERLRLLHFDMMWVFVETILFRRHPIVRAVLFTGARLVGRTQNLQRAIERGLMVLTQA